MLHGELALRVNDWVDYDENAQFFDNKMIDMGWMFRNTSSNLYDGLRVKFLYNSTMTNNPTEAGYSRFFILEDVHAPKLDIDEDETSALKVDYRDNHWELERHKSKKVCLEPGVCAFIVGFKRSYLTSDKYGQDIKILNGYGQTYLSYGFYAQYRTDEFNLKSNGILKERYAITEKDLKI